MLTKFPAERNRFIHLFFGYDEQELPSYIVDVRTVRLRRGIYRVSEFPRRTRKCTEQHISKLFAAGENEYSGFKLNPKPGLVGHFVEFGHECGSLI